ncbi:MAG TPA: hypothetical protein PLK06_03275 [bacterium]|nr:hypothetical protein [bacterium]
MADTTKKKMRWIKIAVPILVVLLLVAVGVAGYLYYEMASLKKSSPAVAEEDVQKLVAEVGELIVLPADEMPTVATVAEPEKLKDQAFFANAKAGDRVLLYTNAKKAILYDPEAHKIVEVAPINLGPDATKTIPEPDVAGAADESGT